MSDICLRAADRAKAQGLTRLADDFEWASRWGDLYFAEVSDADRKFLIEVLREILADETFFAWIDDGPEPDLVFRHEDGSITRPEDPRGVSKRGCYLGVRRAITNLESLIQQGGEGRNE